MSKVKDDIQLLKAEVAHLQTAAHVFYGAPTLPSYRHLRDTIPANEVIQMILNYLGLEIKRSAPSVSHELVEKEEKEEED